MMGTIAPENTESLPKTCFSSDDARPLRQTLPRCVRRTSAPLTSRGSTRLVDPQRAVQAVGHEAHEIVGPTHEVVGRIRAEPVVHTSHSSFENISTMNRMLSFTVTWRYFSSVSNSTVLRFSGITVWPKGVLMLYWMDLR